jgi:hypothetical protein
MARKINGTRFYLMNDSRMDTGESFMTEVELHHWYHDTVGEWPDATTKRAMRNGDGFRVGARYYSVEKRETHSLSAAC